jgi:hypothetical protein
MRRVVGSAVIIFLFLFFLSLPLLHLHPGLGHTIGAVIHCHMPHAAEVHHGSSAAGSFFDDVDSDELKAVSLEISALSAAVAAQAPAPEWSAILPIGAGMEPDSRFESCTEPDPRAQVPPGILMHLSLRSPPA